jgi:hypothetical protein
MVGKGTPISVQGNIDAHFSQRKEIFRFPSKLDYADTVILWLDSPTKNIHTDSVEKKEKRQFIIGMLDNHFFLTFLTGLFRYWGYLRQ